METYILDTNLFFNMEEGLDLGTKTEEVIVRITRVAKELKKREQTQFVIPPRIREEILSFFDNKDQGFLNEFFSAVVIKSPNAHDIAVSADIVAQLVDDIRQRSYRGMRVGEEEIDKAGRLMQGKTDLSKKDFEMTIGEVVKKYRERYRQATRVGFLDSLADLDLILLAKETKGILVTTDMGVLHWARIFGVTEMPAAVFGTKMREVA